MNVSSWVRLRAEAQLGAVKVGSRTPTLHDEVTVLGPTSSCAWTPWTRGARGSLADHGRRRNPSLPLNTLKAGTGACLRLVLPVPKLPCCRTGLVFHRGRLAEPSSGRKFRPPMDFSCRACALSARTSSPYAPLPPSGCIPPRSLPDPRKFPISPCQFHGLIRMCIVFVWIGHSCRSLRV